MAVTDISTALTDCRYALHSLPDAIFWCQRGDEFLVKISADYYAIICPDDGTVPEWARGYLPAGSEWSGETETVGEAMIVHVTRRHSHEKPGEPRRLADCPVEASRSLDMSPTCLLAGRPS